MLKKLLPDHHVDSIYDIDLEELKNRGIKGIITDLDNTLIEWDRPDATPKLAQWLKHVQDSDFQLVVVSNNQQRRVKIFCEPLGIRFIPRARKPFMGAFKKAQQWMDLEPENVVVIGDQLFTDVLGGNRLSLYTILVIPVTHSDGLFTRINRRFEKSAMKAMRRRGWLVWEKPETTGQEEKRE